MENALEAPSPKWRQQDVNVIVHNHPRREPVSLAVKGSHGGGHEVALRWSESRLF
jgi:hypothetical protein